MGLGRSVTVAGTVALLAAACGGAEEPSRAEIVAPPAAASSGATRILAVGDFGVGGEAQRSTGAAMKAYERRRPARLLLTLGDNDYTEDPAAFEENWRESFGWLGAANVGVAGVLGNHDVAVDGGEYQFDLLDMPRAYYSRRVGKIHLFVLDSNDVSGEQTTWLEERLAASSAEWKVVAVHHPPYNCGRHPPASSVESAWVPLFERYGVRLVLSGHDHNYQRFARRDGVTYVIHGGGGADLYPIDESCPAGHPRLAVARSRHGFVALRATDDFLRLTVLTRGRDVLDRLTTYP